jgi:hypothetical protein
MPRLRSVGERYFIEWSVIDIETNYYFTFDDAFLAAEKDYMEGYSDYVAGERRLWAAETLARGTNNYNY